MRLGFGMDRINNSSTALLYGNGLLVAISISGKRVDFVARVFVNRALQLSIHLF
jgi:hypothetical protein